MVLAERPFRLAPDKGVKSPDNSQPRNPTAWYEGRLLAPSPDKGVHAIFNGPIFAVGKRLFHLPRIMNQPQVPGVPDKTAFFGVYELLPNEHQIIKHPPISLENIKGETPVHAEYGIEDLRVTELDGLFFCTATAERNGTPFPMLFSLRPTTTGLEVNNPMEILQGIDSGKNTLLLTHTTALHRLETDDDRVVVIKKNQTTHDWETIDEIVFPYITAYNEHAKDNGGGKKRIGLTGGVRIPMPNGNFRWVLHEVINTTTDYTHSDSISTYQFRLAEFSLDANGIPKLVAVDPEPLLTYDQVIALAGPGVEPDPKKQVIYSVGGAIDENALLFPVTVRDREEHLFQIPLTELQRPFDVASTFTSKRMAPYA